MDSVTTVTYDMEQFLRSCVDRYLEVAGDVKLNKVVAPGTHEETKETPFGSKRLRSTWFLRNGSWLN